MWAVEHHFLEEYSHSSAPELFLTACAMQTKKIRVGHGIVVCVPQFNHPIRVAERAAVLDILSGGRLEFGTGRSATWTELGGFRADPDVTKKTWDEFVHTIPQMWMNERFGYEGEFFSMPTRAVLPKPYQKPHPPMWVAVSSPGTEFDAADRGMGALGVNFTTFKAQEERVAGVPPAHPALHAGRRVRQRPAGLGQLPVLPRGLGDRASRPAASMIGTFQYLAGQLDMAKEAWPTKGYPSPGLLAATRRSAAGPAGAGEPPEGIAIGNPDQVIRELKKWESTGVDLVNFILNANEMIPQEQVLESLRTFGREVMPAFDGARS